MASALVRMGATSGPVDETKFGRELEEVILKISAMTPDLIVSSSTTPISTLWNEAQTLRKMLDVHRDAIASAAQNGGISGWMRLGGEANRIGEARYGKLVAILNARPETANDLAIMGRTALEDDMRSGSFGWAGEQVAQAVVTFHGNMAA